jgi:manganese oxidase
MMAGSSDTKHKEEQHRQEERRRKPSRRDLLIGGAAVVGGSGLTGIAHGQATQPAEEHRPDLARSARYPMRAPESEPLVRPWQKYLDRPVPPGLPGQHYKPVFVPNGQTLPFRIVDGWKVFHLIVEPIIHTVADGLTLHAWGINGRTPGPVIEAVQGDRVRIFVTNHLPVRTSTHWHAVILPNGMDGVGAVTQPHILPGQTFMYEYAFPDHGTFMYHSHVDNMTQEGLGVAGMLIVHPREPADPPPDRDFVILLHEFFVPGGTFRPNPLESVDFNILTMNGKVLPATHPLVCQLGDHVRIRIGNLSQMSHHPIHLHGHSFRITATDGGPIPRAAQWPETTVLVSVGTTRDIEFFANNPGDWVMHCHMTHHTMNQMGHGFILPLGVDDREVSKKIEMLIPNYMTMGKGGMIEMASMKMPIPENSIPMLGLRGQFGATVFGGMATIVKIREHAPTYDDPGWYEHPQGTVAHVASPDILRANEITP